MRQEFFTLEISTEGQKLYDFTEQTIGWINKSKLNNGILNLSILHTSASLIVQENADPDVQTDLINFFINWYQWTINYMFIVQKVKMICHLILNLL